MDKSFSKIKDGKDYIHSPDIEMIRNHCDNIKSISDKIEFIRNIKTHYELIFLDKCFIYKYKREYFLIIEFINNTYEQLLKEESIYNRVKSKELFSENADVHPRFNYDIDKIFTYGSLFKDKTKQANYFNLIKTELNDFIIRYKSVFIYIFEGVYRNMNMSKYELQEKASQEYKEYVQDTIVAKKKIRQLNKLIKHQGRNKNNEEISRNTKKRIIGKFIWLKEVKILKNLIQLLQEYDFIENNLEKDSDSSGFLANFIDKDYNKITEVKPIRIRHIGTDTEICMIVGELKRGGYIADIDIWENSLKIFNFKKGKTANALSNAYTTGKPRRWKIFEKILRQIN